MSGEHRPRTHRLVNPEQCAALLRRVLLAWDADDSEGLHNALGDARKLLAAKPSRESGDAE